MSWKFKAVVLFAALLFARKKIATMSYFWKLAGAVAGLFWLVPDLADKAKYLFRKGTAS